MELSICTVQFVVPVVRGKAIGWGKHGSQAIKSAKKKFYSQTCTCVIIRCDVNE